MKMLCEMYKHVFPRCVSINGMTGRVVRMRVLAFVADR
jgi:hypothetical protein